MPFTNFTSVNVASSLVTPITNVTDATIGTGRFSYAGVAYFANILGQANVGSLVSGTLKATATNTTGKTNISGASAIPVTPSYVWTNTNANFADVCNAVAQILTVIKGL